MRLLITHDKTEISEHLISVLNRNNYNVDIVSEEKEIIDYITSGNYDGVLLDNSILSMDTLAILTKIRAMGCSIPILLIINQYNLNDLVNGLDAGADDCLSQPYTMVELTARIRAMLRRKNTFQPDILVISQAILNKRTYELSHNNQTVHLNKKEFQIMEMLMSHLNQIITNDQMIEKIWGWETDVTLNTIWVTISNLRVKLNQLHIPLKICSKRGVGYYLIEL